SALLRAGAQVVPIVEGDRPAIQEPDHGLAVRRHRGIRALRVVLRGLAPEVRRLLYGQAHGDVAAQWVVRARLVGDDVRREPPPEQLGEDLGRVADQADGDWLTRRGGPLGPTNRLVDRCGLAVQIARLDPPLDARGVDLDADRDALV